MTRQGKLDLKAMGRNIQKLRMARGLSQAELARKTGCSAQHISRLERGLCGMSVGVFMGLCRELVCMPSDLLDGAE